MLRMWLLQLLAELPTAGLDGIPGAPAWVGTGLLGGVLGWLLFVHLPNKDKQIAGLLSDHDEQMRAKDVRHDTHVEAIAKQYAEQDRERRADYRESLQAIVAHCEKETSQTGAALRKLMEEVREELRRGRGASGPPS